MKRPVFRRMGDYWFLDVADPFEPLPPQIDEQRIAPYPFDRVLFDGSRLSDSWKVPPPDRSWVTTEDIKEGWPSARRPKQWYPGGGTDKTRIWVLVPIAWGLFAAVVLLIGTLP